MGKIRSLDETTINQIAAGEVVEDPASVIKELVENAIDAGADEVVIQVKGGGRQLIRVSDNGSGMSDDDARLCLERHATSKIGAVDDILAVATMGFRGEAIPSIASISKFLILTSEGPEKGTMVIVDGGTLVSQAAAARSRGTTIEVKELFFNVPARKKFQRSPTHDSNAIVKVVTTLALANPTVRFELIDNQSQVVATAVPSDASLLGQLSDRIFDLLGHEFLGELSPITAEMGEITLTGFVGNSMVSRPNRSGQYLFINRRAVAAPAVAYAVREGYGSALPPNRHPIFLLHLSIPGDTVDVNVHPQKREVRLRRQHELKQMIAAAVEQALNVAIAPPSPAFEQQEQSEEPRPFAGINWIEEEPHVPFTRVEEAPPLPVAPLPTPQQVPLIPEEKLPPILATIPGYIIAAPTDGAGGLWLIDQRSAHCRVVYEQLQAAAPGSVAQEALLMPYTLDLSAHEAAVLRRHLDALNDVGIEIREFGSQTFAVDALPQVFGSIDVQQFLNDLIQGLQEEEQSSSYARAAHKRIAIDASRSALSSREKIALPQAQALVRALFSCQSPYQCPLGRVTVAKLSQQQLAKHF